jgi:hypothetical protein
MRIVTVGAGVDRFSALQVEAFPARGIARLCRNPQT